MTHREKTAASNAAFEAAWMLALLSLAFFIPAAAAPFIGPMVLILAGCGAAVIAAAAWQLARAAWFAL